MADTLGDKDGLAEGLGDSDGLTSADDDGLGSGLGDELAIAEAVGSGDGVSVRVATRLSHATAIIPIRPAITAAANRFTTGSNEGW